MSDSMVQFERLRDWIRRKERIAVAFSGGIDSTLLLYAANAALTADADLAADAALTSKATLNENVIALIADIETMPQAEINEAKSFCEDHQISYKIIKLDILKLDSVKNNRTDRCYICKTAIFKTLLAYANELGFDTLIDGSNADDDPKDRPGMRALEELGIESPFRELGIKKATIRTMAKECGLNTWSKPSSPCLATRFSYNSTLDGKKLDIVEKAEAFLKCLGFKDCRVRVIDLESPTARIEVPSTDIARLCIIDREAILQTLTNLGFKYVCIDLAGRIK